jgi:Purple acid Phosphatase, N-terminal domain
MRAHVCSLSSRIRGGGWVAIWVFALVMALSLGARADSGRAAALDLRSPVLAAPAATFDVGPGGPVAIVTCPGDPIGNYYGEILRAEGLNEFTIMSLADVGVTTTDTLAPFDTVILARCTLSGQEAVFTNWVAAGGNLIAMRPDRSLASLVGLQWPQSGTLSDAYLKVDGTSTPAAGITAQTMQFHGTADTWGFNGAKAVAWLYSDASTITSPNRPAVTIRNFGTSGGQAAAFTYDLARSVIQTRQGNPAWAGDERDAAAGGQELVRSDDLFYGAKTGDVKPDWVNLNEVQIPQADEQQRLLANMITQMNVDREPLPRFWYLPHGKKAAVVMTGDDHANGGTAGRFDTFLSDSPAGCSAADWECVRSTSYLSPGSPITAAQAKSYQDQGFELALHTSTGCTNFTATSLEKDYSDQLAAFEARYPSLAPSATNRTHCIAWSDWASQPKTQLAHGIRLDTNYYYFPPSWIQDRPGMFTGSGFPMRFADVDGSLIDVYQAVTQMTDESGQTYPHNIDTLLDNALGPNGYYGVFTANMHTDTATSADANAIVDSAQARGVPVVSARQMLTWLDARNSSAFTNISYTGGVLTFTVAPGSGARGLQAMIPANAPAGPLNRVTRDGTAVPVSTNTIKGIDYAFVDAAAGTYTATYVQDTAAPAISAVSAAPHQGGSATVTWTTDEPSSSRVSYGTSAGTLDHAASNAALVTNHSVQLTNLAANTDYYFQVSSTDPSGNVATAPQVPASFTTLAATLIDTTTADFGAGTVAGAYVGASDTSDDGEVLLAPAVGTEFDGNALPAGWTQAQWTPGSGSTAVAGGTLTLDGTYAGTTGAYPSGRSLEFVATFGNTAFQHVGFGVDYNTTNAWAMFSTGGGTLPVGLWARTTNGTAQDTQITTVSPTIPHRYRIDWTASTVTFFIDGQQVAQHTIAISPQMRPLASDLNTGGPSVSVDWLRLSPYATTGTFISRVLDGGRAGADWQTLTATTKTPTWTQLVFETRSGESAVPDSSWSAWQAVDSGGAIANPNGRYVQYRVALGATDPEPMSSPVVERVEISYDGRPNGAPIAGTVTLSSHTGTTNDKLTATVAGFQDPDGDQLSMHYRWLKGGTAISGQTAATLDLATAGNGDRGDTITVEAFASDGRGGTSATVSDSATVANTPPSAGSVTLSPAGPARNGTLTAQPTGFSDDDGDQLTYQYSWTRNGTMLDGQSGPTLDLAQLSGDLAGEMITVSVTANDGHGGITDPAAASVTVSDLSKVVDTTTAEFAAGTVSGAYVVASAGTDDGELALAPTIGEEFTGTALPAGWTTSLWAPPAGSVNVGNGALTIDAAKAGTSATYGPGRSLEFVARFSGAKYQHVGFAADYEQPPWTMFSTKDGTGLYARTAATGSAQDTLIPGVDVSVPHRYRIEWTASAATYYVDGAQVASHAIAIGAEMRPLASDLDAGGGTVDVEWLRMSPVTSTGTFTSRVLDAGARADWPALDAADVLPAGTQATFETRTGGTPTPEQSWSDWQALAPTGTIASPPGRYLQYRVSLSTADTTLTPTVESVAVYFRNIANSPPTAGTVTISPPAPTTNDILTATPSGFHDPDSDQLNYQYQWSVNGQPITGATGSTFDLALQGHGDRGDTVRVEVSADDGHGGQSSAITDQVTVVNSAPSKGTVAITPTSPSTNQTLTATPASFSDADSDALNYEYRWSVNGTAVSGATSNTLDLSLAGHGEHGDTAQVEVRASDGHAANSAWASQTVTIANTAPIAGRVTITPSSPTTNQTLTATPADFTDPDRDTLSYHYQWSVNGTPANGATGSTLDLSKVGNGDRGDKITVRLSASDGTASSADAIDEVTIANSAPAAGSVTITPANPTTNQTLTATPAGFTDPDGDELTYSYQWSVNGTPINGATGSTLALSAPGHGNAGDSVAVHVSADDGHGASSPAVSDEAKISALNANPDAGTVKIAPHSPTTNQMLIATPAGFTDRDGDRLTYTYRWLRNGTPIPGATNNTLDLSAAGHGDPGDTIEIELYVSDPHGADSAKATDRVSVVNSAPATGSVKVTPTAPRSNAIVTAVASGFADPDRDQLTYSYQWSVNGTPLAGATGSRLDLGRALILRRGDAVSVSVSASDRRGGRSTTAIGRVKITAQASPKPWTLTLRTLAASGLRATVSTPPRTRVLDYTVYRSTGTRAAVLRGRIAVSKGGMITVRWRPNRSAVSRLRAGTYTLLVRGGPDARHLSTLSARITIRLTGSPVRLSGR